MRPNWSLILERTKRRVKKRGEEKRKRKKKKKKKKKKRKGMDAMMILYGLYGMV